MRSRTSTVAMSLKLANVELVLVEPLSSGAHAPPPLPLVLRSAPRRLIPSAIPLTYPPPGARANPRPHAPASSPSPPSRHSLRPAQPSHTPSTQAGSRCLRLYESSAQPTAAAAAAQPSEGQCCYRVPYGWRRADHSLGWVGILWSMEIPLINTVNWLGSPRIALLVLADCSLNSMDRLFGLC